MSHNPNNKSENELELAQRIIDLTKIVDKNNRKIEKVKEDQKQGISTLEKWEKQLQDWDLNLEKKFDEIKQIFSSLEERIDLQTQYAEKKNEDVENQFSELESTQKEHGDLISSQQQAFQEQMIEIQARVLEEHFETKLSEIREDIKENNLHLSQKQEEIKQDFTNFRERTQSRFENNEKTIELIGDGLTQIEKRNKEHDTLLEEHRESFNQFKQKLKELVSLTKEDQKNHFVNFSRIIESYNENLRTELTITVQSLKESDTQILDEVSASFMPKKTGKELRQTITDLTNELKSEAQKTREELIQGLQKNVQEYETTMEEQNTTIKNYQLELKSFQDEILAIIDRKVNEKYEVVFSLLSQVVTQAEELALLIKTSEIQIPSSPFQTKENSSDINDRNTEENHGKKDSNSSMNQ